jgi:RimJ/RimL family protein N-acetyltransferase
MGPDPGRTDVGPAQTIVTERLTLEPLRVDDADAMAAVLDDDAMHTFTGGHPATPAELRDRYRRLVAGSPDPDQLWLNWTVRVQPEGTRVGAVQATVTCMPQGAPAAEVAWEIGVAWQGRGFATEAAIALIAWLLARGVATLTAHIHPDHAASSIVAHRASLRPTDAQVDGETVWRLTADR